MSAVKEKTNKGKQYEPDLGGQQNEQSTVGTIVDTVTEKTKDVGNAVAEFAGQIKDKATECGAATADAAMEATDKTRELAVAAADSVQDLGKEATNLIRRYPVPAILVGLGVGFLLGKAACSSRG